MSRKQTAAKLHQRIAEELPMNSVVSISIVDDPYSSIGEKIQVLRSVRDDPLAGLHARGQIDDAQLAAGRMWQRYYEDAEIGSVRAIDPGKEAVDGGRIPEPFTDRQRRAVYELTRARRELLIDGKKLNQDRYGLIVDILGSRATIRLAAEKRGRFTKYGWEKTGSEFRASLESLAILWGFAMAS